MADSVMPNPGESPSGGPNRDKRRPAFSVRQAQRDLREAERTLADYQKRKVQGKMLDDAKEAVKKAQRTLEDMTSGSRGDRREARQEYMEDYYNELGGPWIAELVSRDPELRRLFQKAIRTDDLDGFMDDLYQSDWWNDPKKSGTWKNAFRLEFAKDKTAWNDRLDDVKRIIEKEADRIYNIVIPSDILDQIARRFIYQGWDENDNEGLKTWLAKQFGKQEAGDTELTPGGELLDTERALSDAVRSYGVVRDQDWISKTARDVLNPDSDFTLDDAWNELIADAESLFPVFAGRLSKDRSVRDLAAGYLSQMANMLEIRDPNLVELSDPLLQRALTNLNENSEPTLMPLWEFSKQIRSSDRWQMTDNARDTYMSAASKFAKALGLAG